jgi:hypothetical protein
VSKVQINNEIMEFAAGTRNEARIPTLSYRYRTKTAEIAAGDVPRYRLNLEQIGKVISLVFHAQALPGQNPRRPDRSHNWLDEETSSAPVQRSYRPAPRSGSTVPVWLIVVFCILVLRVIAAIIGAGS